MKYKEGEPREVSDQHISCKRRKGQQQDGTSVEKEVLARKGQG